MTPFDQIKKDFQGKTVLILGLGLQGRGVGDAKFFAELGSKVVVSDQKTQADLQNSINQLTDYDIEYKLGEQTNDLLSGVDLIIRNASVPWNHQVLQSAREKQIPVKMDAALFFEYCQPDKSIAVTGTRGKTTTTLLISHILKTANIKHVLAGNLVPTPSVDLIKEYSPDTWYLFELSSWQLQAFHDLGQSPHLSVFTNIYPDHLLDRDFDNYLKDKTAIYQYQKKQDKLIINQQQKARIFKSSSTISQIIEFNPDQASSISTSLVGTHNQENISAAMSVAKQLNIDDTTTTKALGTFRVPPFRLEKIATHNQTDFINDTTSTTPIATIKALQAYPNSTLIVGGTSKNLPVEDLISVINKSAKHIITLPGTGTDQIVSKINPGKLVVQAKDLESAIQSAISVTQPGDTILFSPGFTSFGLFTNEFDRGEKFNQFVGQLNEKQT